MELIKIDTDHFVVVDDSEIKEGDWFLPISGIGWELNKPRQADSSGGYSNGHCKKITHSTNIDWNDVYYIPLQEVKELLGEVDMEKLYYKLQDDFIDECDDIFHYYSFVKGYNQALEDNKAKKYTEEDLKYMFECGRNYQNNAEITFKVSFEYLLQTKTSWQVEFIDGKLKLK